MTSVRMFLTLTSLQDASRHQDYNAWHQLDHLPENLALSGVAWGDRWVRTADCIPVSRTDDERHAHTQYAVMYWFRAPADASVSEWTALNQRAIWWGRRPDLSWTRRDPIGFFDPVKTYVAPRVLVAPDALMFRPARGIHLTLTRMAEPTGPGVVDLMATLDRVWVPRLLEVPGVAGVSTYRFTDGGEVFGTATDSGAGTLVRMLHLDDDPVETTRRITEVVPEWVTGRAGYEELLFSSPFRTITPWAWQWFDRPARLESMIR